MITFLMLVAWVFLAIDCPKIFYGYSWEELCILKDDPEIQTTSRLIQKLGITDENITQKANKQFYTCIGIVIGCLILVFIIRKLLKIFERYIDRKNRVAEAEANQKIRDSKYGIETSKSERKSARIAVKKIISSNQGRTPEENIEIINKLAYLDEEKPRKGKNNTSIVKNNKQSNEFMEEVPEVESMPEINFLKTDADKK